MDCLSINGPAHLRGTIRAGGSKNAALPIMAAAILADGPMHLAGVPRLVDVDTMSLLLGYLGIAVKRATDGDMLIELVDPRPTIADRELVESMRASFCVLGPLLARRGRAVVPLPGGCQIGARPVDLHIAGLAALGASINIERGCVIATARRLRGAHIDLGGPHGPTVTGTANVMSAATLARGTTVITGAALEPEIEDLGRCLIAMGARIHGLGTANIEIQGVDQLQGASHRVISDRIEAGTLLIAAAITGSAATVANVHPTHLTAVLDALSAAGAGIAFDGDAITIRGPQRPRPLHLAARPYPGIPTDLQAQFMALMSLAEGRSTIRDCVFPDRFGHIAHLERLGAKILRCGSTAIIEGQASFTGTNVIACDLRASAALVLAGLAARGQTTVERVDHLDRGYERLEQKLGEWGAGITRQPSHSPRVHGDIGIPSVTQPAER